MAKIKVSTATNDQMALAILLPRCKWTNTVGIAQKLHLNMLQVRAKHKPSN